MAELHTIQPAIFFLHSSTTSSEGKNVPHRLTCLKIGPQQVALFKKVVEPSEWEKPY